MCALWIRVRMTESLCSAGWCELKFKKCERVQQRTLSWSRNSSLISHLVPANVTLSSWLRVCCARSWATSILSSAKPPSPNLTYAECAALHDFKSNQSIIVLPTDKGKPTVGLTSIKYVDKMKKLLSYPSLFMKLTCNRKPKSERELPAWYAAPP